MTSFLYRMPQGIPGDITRQSMSTVEAQVFDGSNAFPGYGLPGKLNSGKFSPLVGSETGSQIYGFLVRPFPTQGVNASDALGTSVPKTSGIADILRRGYISVKNNSGTAAIGAPVYTRVAAASGGKPIGGIEAAADATVAGGVITGTGTGTIAATIGNAATVIPGTWSLILLATSATAAVQVVDPLGIRHPDAKVGTAYSSGGLNFTITNGGTMTAGDSFSPVVTANTVAIPNATFMSAADASGNVEIGYNI